MWLSDLFGTTRRLFALLGGNLEQFLIRNELSVQPEAIDDVGTRQPVEEENANHCKPQCHKNFKASQMVVLGADGVVSGDRERKTAPSPFCQACHKFPAVEHLKCIV